MVTKRDDCAHIIGGAMTNFGKFPDRSVRDLAEEASAKALADAGLTTADVQMVFFANAAAGVITGQDMIRGQVALRYTGLLGVPIVNVENACASASSAFHLALMAVLSGSIDVALVLGAEKLTHPDKRVSFGAISAAVDVSERDQLGVVTDGQRSGFMDLYAERAKRYLELTGATQMDFAKVAVKSHFHAARNPKAQYRMEVTVDDVLNSREIVYPLTLLMCSPIGDGAAAVVVCSADYARRLGAESVRVASCALVSGRVRADGEPGVTTRAARLAYEQAGVGPEDLDVVELHDAAAPAELMIYEDLGLCAAGEGAKLLRSGATRLGGRVPVNTSGGLLSKGHPIGATGCAQLVEVVDQLRGRCGDRQVDGAHVGLAENGGGNIEGESAALVVTVLTR